MYKATILRDVTAQEALNASPCWFSVAEGVQMTDVLYHQGDICMASVGDLVWQANLGNVFVLPEDAYQIDGEAQFKATFVRDVTETEVSNEPRDPQRVVYHAGNTHDVDIDGSVFEDGHKDFWWPPEDSFTISYEMAERQR